MSPGVRIGSVVATAVDKHFDEEIEAYCVRHGLGPSELEVNIIPGRRDDFIMTLAPKDLRLILPKRVFRLIVKLASH